MEHQQMIKEMTPMKPTKCRMTRPSRRGVLAALLLLAGNLESRDVLSLVTDCFRFIRDFRDEVPGASAKDCGNYLDMNLPMANYWGAKYTVLLENITEAQLIYPE